MLVVPDEWALYTQVEMPENVTALLAAASSAVTDHCGWSISQEAVTGQKIDSAGSWLLRLPTLHLTDVTEVLVDDEEIIAGTDFTFSTAGMLDRRPLCWPDGFGRVEASYVHGYAEVPANVKAVVVGLAVRNVDADPRVVSETVGAIARTFREQLTAGLSDFDKLALNKYRLEPV